jgi:hypothetical protein
MHDGGKSKPERWNSAPGWCGVSAERNGGAAGRRGGVAGRNGGAPGRRNSAPGGGNSAPAASSDAPERRNSAPAPSSDAPGRANSAPAAGNSAPARNGGTAERAKSSAFALIRPIPASSPAFWTSDSGSSSFILFSPCRLRKCAQAFPYGCAIPRPRPSHENRDPVPHLHAAPVRIGLR